MIEVACGVMYNKDNKILMGKRMSKNENYPNKWEFPGGQKEKNDSVLILAIEDFTSAIDLNDQYVQSYHNRGLCHELMGDFISAKVDYATALKIDPFFTLSVKALNSLDSIQ